MKIFYFDCETTGLDAKLNDIITLAFIIEVDGVIKEKAEFKMQPFNWDNISQEALDVNGITLEQLKTFEPPQQVYKKLISLFSKYVDKYKKNKTVNDKFVCCGYNVNFDIGFLTEFFKKNGDNYVGSFIDYHKLDLASIVLFLKLHGVLQIDGFKLKVVSEHFKIQIDAHDATSDINATRELSFKLLDKMKEIK